LNKGKRDETIRGPSSSQKRDTRRRPSLSCPERARFWLRGSGRRHGAERLDLLVEFEKCPTLFALIDFQFELEEILNVPIEILLEDDTPRMREPIREEIIAEAVPLEAFQRIELTLPEK